MVQGLGFLSKKSWHTKNIANQERVWMAEERERAEKAKTAELSKQIQQEREEEELRKIAGGKKLDRGIDWMYNGHLKDSETAKEDASKQAEEFLLGKPVEATVAGGGDLDVANEPEGVNAIVAAASEAPPVDSVAQRNEDFHMRHEDPMYGVKLQKLALAEEIEHRKELYAKVGIGKRKDKKHKKDKKKRTKRKQYSSDEDSYNRKRKRTHSDEDSYNRRRIRRERSPDRRRRHESPDSDEEDHRRRRRERSYSPDDRRRSTRERSYSPDGGRRRRRSRDEYDGRHRRRDDRKEPPSHDDRKPPPTRQADNDFKPRPDDRRYGLQGTTTRPTGDLGPDRELLDRKRKELEELKRRRTEPRRHADREEALRAMQRDAEAHAKIRTAPRDREDDREQPRQSHTEFLHDTIAHAHGMKGDSSLSDRLQQNRHRNQKESDAFL